LMRMEAAEEQEVGRRAEEVCERLRITQIRLRRPPIRAQLVLWPSGGVGRAAEEEEGSEGGISACGGRGGEITGL